MTLSISGGDDNWSIFSKTAQSGRPLLFRSRTRSPGARAFAEQNQMMRVRCVLRDDLITDTGMPASTADLDDYEDRLISNLKQAGAQVYLVAVVTGDGNRDLFFAARDLDHLRAAIKASDTDVDTFKVQYAPIADIPPFLNMLTLSDEQIEAAQAAGRVHGVPVDKKGNLLGKLFGR